MNKSEFQSKVDKLLISRSRMISKENIDFAQKSTREFEEKERKSQASEKNSNEDSQIKLNNEIFDEKLRALRSSVKLSISEKLRLINLGENLAYIEPEKNTTDEEANQMASAEEIFDDIFDQDWQSVIWREDVIRAAIDSKNPQNVTKKEIIEFMLDLMTEEEIKRFTERKEEIKRSKNLADQLELMAKESISQHEETKESDQIQNTPKASLKSDDYYVDDSEIFPIELPIPPVDNSQTPSNKLPEPTVKKPKTLQKKLKPDRDLNGRDY